MRKALLTTLTLALILCWSSLAFAVTAQEVVDLVKSTGKFYQEKGAEATLAAVNDKNGPFFKGDLYVFMGPMEKPELAAHPLAPQLIGKDMSMMKDIKGKLFQMEFLRIAKEKGSGWTEYYWPKPGTKEPLPKATYILKSSDGKYWFGCGTWDLNAQAAEAQAK